MTVKIAGALSAYANAAQAGKAPGMEPRAASGGGSFAKVLEDAAKSAVGNLRAGEQASMAAAAGKADLLDVVAAVNNAEVTLQTVVSVRDQVIQAYNDIIRMPI